MNKYKVKKYIIYILCIVSIFVVVFRPFKNNNDITFLTQEAKLIDIQKAVNVTGAVGAITLVNIGAQASGKIEKLYVELGQEVKNGDLIAEIDSTTQQNEVNINKSKLKSYGAQLEAAKISLEVADSQYQRAINLFNVKAISTELYESVKNNYASIMAQVAQLEETINQVQIALSTSEKNLSYTKITATLDGTIVSIPVKEGQTVNANMTTPTIVQIADLSEMEILMEISEGDIVNVKVGSKVTYSILGDSSQVYETTLKSIDPGLTLLSNGSYTGVVDSNQAVYYYGKLVVPNADRKLRIGMTTQNIIHVANVDNAVSVSAFAISNSNNKQYVKVLVGDNKVEDREVTTGLSDSINVEIKSGVKQGEKVIISQMSADEISKKISSSSMRGKKK